MSNVERAKEVVEMLNQMEQAGEFQGLTPQEKEVQKQTLGMRIRSSME